MLIFAAVLFFSSQVLARPNPEFGIDPFIVGGSPAEEGQFPYIVSIRNKMNVLSCGGALVTDRHVVTAAHCLDKKSANDLKIGVGSIKLDSQTFYSVNKLIIHPQFINSTDNQNDIGIMVLQSPVKLDKLVQTITYPTNDVLEDKPVIALGWGRTGVNAPISKTLLYLKGQTIRNENCSKLLHSDIGPGQICLGGENGKGLCFGDSGSPLVYKGKDGKDYFSGIVSYGVPCAKGYPDVFTRVSHYTKWIKENTK